MNRDFKKGDKVEFIFKFDRRTGTIVNIGEGYYDIEFTYYNMYGDGGETSIYSISEKCVISKCEN